MKDTDIPHFVFLPLTKTVFFNSCSNLYFLSLSTLTGMSNHINNSSSDAHISMLPISSFLTGKRENKSEGYA